MIRFESVVYSFSTTFEGLKFDFIKKFDIEKPCSNYIKKLKPRGLGLKIRWFYIKNDYLYIKNNLRGVLARLNKN